MSNKRDPSVVVMMRRASEARLFFIGFPRDKKSLHNGSYEHRLPKRNKKKSSVQCMGVIQHRNWRLRSTIVNASGTNCCADELYARTHINEPHLCYYVVRRSKLAEADAETCVLQGL